MDQSFYTKIKSQPSLRKARKTQVKKIWENLIPTTCTEKRGEREE